MASVLQELLVRLGLDASGMDKEARKAEQQLNRISQNLTKAGSALTAAFTVPIGLVGGGSVKAFADFDAAMTESLAIMGNVSEALRTDMASAAREMAKQSTFSATDAGKAFYYLASAGLDAKASIEALPVVTQFAQAGMFDLSRATDLLTDAQSALGLTIRDDAVANMQNMVRVADVLVKANTLANASVEQFSEALTTKAGAALRALGKDVEEGVAVLAAFADQGTKGSEAGTQFSIVLRDLQTKAINNKTAFKEMGIAVFDSQGEMRNLGDIIANLEKALAGMSDEQKKSTLLMLGFSDKSMAAMLSLLGTSDAIKGYETNLRAAGGTTKEVADKQLQTFSAQMSLLKSRVIDAGIELGSALVPTLQKLIGVADPVVNFLSSAAKWFGDLPTPIQVAAIAFAGLLAAIGPVLMAVGMALPAISALGGVLGGLTGALTILLPAVAAFGVALAVWDFGKALADIPEVTEALSKLKEVTVGVLEWFNKLVFGQASTAESTKHLAAEFRAMGPPMDDVTAKMEAVRQKAREATEEATSFSRCISQFPLITFAEALRNCAQALGIFSGESKKVKEVLEKKLDTMHSFALKTQGADISTAALTASLKKSQKQLEDLKKPTAQAAKETEEYKKETERLTKAYEDWTRKAALKRTELVKIGLETAKAKEQTELFEKGLIKLGRETINYQDEARRLAERIHDIERSAQDLMDTMPKMSKEIQDAIGLTIDPVNKLGDAMKTLGLDSIAAKQTIADQMAKARDEVLGSNVATDFEKKTAIYRALKAQIDAAIEAGQEIPKEQRKLLDELEKELSVNLPSKVEGPWNKTMTQVSTSITNAVQGAIGILIGTEEGTLGDAFKKLGQGVLSSFVEPAMSALNDFIEKGIKKLISWLLTETGLMGALGSVGSAIGSIFGGATSAVSTATGAAGTAAGTAGGAAGGVASTAASGVMGTIGVIGSVVSAVSGVISNFQLARQENTLNAIEESTRYAALYLGKRADQGILGVLFSINEQLAWGPATKAVERIRDEMLNLGVSYINPSLDAMKSALNTMRDEIVALGAGYINPSLDSIKTSASDLVAEFRGQRGDVNIYISGAGDPDAVAQKVVAQLKMQMGYA